MNGNVTLCVCACGNVIFLCMYVCLYDSYTH